MKLTQEQKAEIMKKLEKFIDETELRYYDALAEVVYQDPEKDQFLKITLCIEDEI